MKLLLTTIGAVLVVGCGPTQSPDISIWEATATGNIEAVKQHLAAGTDVNTKNRMGWTPLHNAAGVGQKETVKLLITRGANVNAKDKDGVTPLDAATGLKQTETASILRKHGGKTKMELEVTEPVAEPPTAKAPDISIHDAALVGNIEAVKQHIAASTDVNAKNYSGGTPLHGAGTKEVTELLIAAGADVNAKGLLGMTPLHDATQNGRKEIVKLLIAEGADVNAKSFFDETPLDYAKRHPETADLLRKHGGKSGAEDSIHLASKLGNIEAVKTHLAAGTDVNARMINGWTPLDNAIQTKQKETADLLRKHGGKTGEELKAEAK